MCMLNLLRLSLVVVLVMLVGCDGVGGEDVIEREGPLLPLQVGNTWTFEQDDGERYTATLAGTEQISGETYYQFLLDYGDYEETSQFIADSTASGERVGTIFLYYIEEENYKESNFFKYPVEDGATYEYTDVRGLSFTYEVEKEVVETPAGTFAAFTYSGYDADPQVSISFSPGIGPVRLTQTGGETVLVGYDVE